MWNIWLCTYYELFFHYLILGFIKVYNSILFSLSQWIYILIVSSWVCSFVSSGLHFNHVGRVGRIHFLPSLNHLKNHCTIHVVHLNIGEWVYVRHYLRNRNGGIVFSLQFLDWLHLVREGGIERHNTKIISEENLVRKWILGAPGWLSQ